MMLILMTQEPDYDSIDVIKSKISPGKDVLLDMLNCFEKREYGNYALSDLCDNLWDDHVRKYREELGLDDEVRINLIYYDDHDFDLEEYYVTLEWMVYELLVWCNFDPIFRTEVPFIRDFLNTPLGQEKVAVEKWNKYWEAIDFSARLDIAPMWNI